MVRLWQRMAENFGHRWSSTYHELPSELWVGTLAELTDDQIARGLHKCIARGDDWPPSAGAFHRLCLGTYEDYGLLDPQAAYTAATRGEMWRKGVYHTVTAISTAYDFRRMDGQKAERLFLGGYERTLEACRRGQALREVPPPPDPARTLERSRTWNPSERSKKIAEDNLDAMRRTLGMPPHPDRTDEEKQP
jgi:hypothetical protein